MTDLSSYDELLYDAWTIIANAHSGNWELATPEWKAAAERWRDQWHELPLSRESDST